MSLLPSLPPAILVLADGTVFRGYAIGAAGYKSQGALGISSRYTAESGRWSLEAGFSKNSESTGGYVGVSGVLGE